MATEVERLTVQFEASYVKFEKALARIEGRTTQSTKRIEKSFAAMQGRINNSFSAVGGKLLAVTGIGISAREIMAYADTWTRATNALKVAGLQGDELTSTMDALFAAAQRQGVPLEALTTLYGRVSRSAKELGASRHDLITFSEDVATALRVAGSSSEEASGSLMQLSQMLGSSRIQAEEFNSIADQVGPILEAAANGIEEAGGSVNKLKALVNDGKISNVAFFKGFQIGVQSIRDQAATAEPTISSAFTRVQNAVARLVGEVDKSAGFTKTFVTEMTDFAGSVVKAKQPLLDIISLLQKLSDLQAYVAQNGLNLGTKFNQGVFGTNTLEDFIWPAPPSGSGIGSDAAAEARANGGRPKIEITKPIKASDFPVVGGKDAKAQLDEYERQVKSLNESTAALKLEISTLGQSAYAIDYAKTRQDLLNAAKEAGRPITAALTAEIDKEAAAHASATQALETAQKQQEAAVEQQHRMIDLQQQFGSLAEDGILGLVDGTKDLNDVLADTLKLMAQMLLKSALLGEGPLGNGGGGLIGALGKGLSGMFSGGTSIYADGGYTGPGGKYDPAGVVHRGEYVFDAAATKRIGLDTLEAIRRGKAGYAKGGPVGLPSFAAGGAVPSVSIPKIQPAARGGGVTFSPSTVIDARGSQMTEAQFRAVLDERDRRLMKQVPAVANAARLRMTEATKRRF
ncbi:tape measure protein [Xanthobacter sediminis]